jgi:hypothetical protein
MNSVAVVGVGDMGSEMIPLVDLTRKNTALADYHDEPR